MRLRPLGRRLDLELLSVATSYLSDGAGNAFYSNSNVLALFRTYIKQLLTTVNPYTGLTLAQEPAVLAFETGNGTLFTARRG